MIIFPWNDLIPYLLYRVYFRHIPFDTGRNLRGITKTSFVGQPLMASGLFSSCFTLFWYLLSATVNEMKFISFHSRWISHCWFHSCTVSISFLANFISFTHLHGLASMYACFIVIPYFFFFLFFYFIAIFHLGQLYFPYLEMHTGPSTPPNIITNHHLSFSIFPYFRMMKMP